MGHGSIDIVLHLWDAPKIFSFVCLSNINTPCIKTLRYDMHVYFLPFSWPNNAKVARVTTVVA